MKNNEDWKILRAEINKKEEIDNPENFNYTKPSGIDVVANFRKQKYHMKDFKSEKNESNALSSEMGGSNNGIFFYITMPNARDVTFSWQSAETELMRQILESKAKDVEKFYEGTGKYKGCEVKKRTRIKINVDQNNILADLINIVESTKSLVGYY